MSVELIFVLAVLAVAVLLFVTEWLKPAVVSMLVLAALLMAGVVSPEEGLSGFSNEATVAVTAMFVLSAGLEKSGIVDRIGDLLGRGLEANYLLGWLGLLSAVAVMSAFINNTAVVAIMIPVLLQCARDADISPTKLLLPVSFASMFGGLCTLIGTSTNLIVSSIVEEHGEPALGMFEFSALGVTFVGAGLVYMLLVQRFLPERREARSELTADFEMTEFLTDLVVQPDSRVDGASIREACGQRDLDILAVARDDEVFEQPGGEFRLESGDIVRIRCDIDALERVLAERGFDVTWTELPDAEMETADAVLIEAVVAPGGLDAETLDQVALRERYGVIPLAIRKAGKLRHRELGRITLSPGDIVLLRAARSELESLREAEELLIVSGHEPDHDDASTPHSMAFAVATIVAVVLLATLDIVPIAVSAVAGCVLMVATGFLKFGEAIEAIDWNVIFLLAGVFALGIALEATGGDRMLSDALVWTTEAFGPVGAISGLYLVGALLTSAMSNNATAALLTPIALATAADLGVDSRPFVMAVAYSASASFLSPVGYQTNTMVYGAGHYRFRDFLIFGTPLTLLFWVMATLLIPYFWPL